MQKFLDMSLIVVLELERSIYITNCKLAVLAVSFILDLLSYGNSHSQGF